MFVDSINSFIAHIQLLGPGFFDLKYPRGGGEEEVDLTTLNKMY